VLKATLSLVVLGLAISLAQIFYAHYAGPGVALASLTLTGAVARTTRSRRWRWPGTAVFPATLLLAVALPVSHIALDVAGREAARKPWSRARMRIARTLEGLPGRHLVFVRVTAQHSIHQEWVYNGADLESGKVLWVRALGPKVNARLVARLGERRAWVVDADADEPRLVPFELRAGAGRQEDGRGDPAVPSGEGDSDEIQ
jgi:hypothetical protein